MLSPSSPRRSHLPLCGTFTSRLRPIYPPSRYLLLGECLPHLPPLSCFTLPSFSDLSLLAKAGVLWLNTSLTVRAHKAGSHSGKGWETFTAAVLRAVTSREDGRGVVFFVWGKPAEKMCKSINIDEVCPYTIDCFPRWIIDARYHLTRKNILF